MKRLKKTTLSIIASHSEVIVRFSDEKDGWYERWENNGWRLVSNRVMWLLFNTNFCKVVPYLGNENKTSLQLN